MIFKTQDSSEIDINPLAVVAFAPHPKSKDEIWTCVYFGSHKIILDYAYEKFRDIVHNRADWITELPASFQARLAESSGPGQEG